jgi:hypothetical protein
MYKSLLSALPSMLRQASWTHGNSLTVETPPNLASIVHIGWGTILRFIPGKSSWCHIPIPTPVIMNDVRAKVQKMFLLFNCKEGEGSIRNIHIYDGPFRIDVRDDIRLSGDHGGGIDSINTITLPTPHEVAWGMSISFLFQAAIGFDTSIPPPMLTITTAGADFI